MSRGFGKMENYLLGLIGREPMTFKQILDIACPEGTFDGDMARALGASSVGITRSRRRALFRLCEKGVLKKRGIKTPYGYQLSPGYLPQERDEEYTVETLGLIYRCMKEDRDASTGALLLEARPQLGSDNEFYDWARTNFGMTKRQVQDCMNAARRAKDNPPEAA